MRYLIRNDVTGHVWAASANEAALYIHLPEYSIFNNADNDNLPCTWITQLP